mmetsp:Transcript_28486/g.59375  ORF Transcript_28486/g.59375 Transcript_28486/m.59375 type:complete len:103 (-) Transcript_28486:1595-1903(-)
MGRWHELRLRHGFQPIHSRSTKSPKLNVEYSTSNFPLWWVCLGPSSENIRSLRSEANPNKTELHKRSKPSESISSSTAIFKVSSESKSRSTLRLERSSLPNT